MIKLHLQSKSKRLYKISKDSIEVMKSLEFSKSTLDEQLGTVKDNIKKLASDMKELENGLLDPNEVLEKLIKSEGRSQKNNFRKEGQTENTNDSQDNCKKKVQEMLPDISNIQDDIEFY